MRTTCCIALMLMTGVFTVFAAPAPAPTLSPLEFVSRSFVLLLWSNPEVREELKLSKDQVQEIEELKEERNKAIQELRGVESRNKLQDRYKADLESLAKILTRKQLNRLAQISLQRIGPMMAFRLPKVAEALKLTDEQKEKVDSIWKESPQPEDLDIPPGGGREALMQKKEEWRKRKREKILNVLTPAQRAKWNLLVGAPFKLEPRRSEK